MFKYIDDIEEWLMEHHLYADDLFYYALIICVWFFIGASFLGVEFLALTQTQNFFINALWYLMICGCMALCPLWFHLFLKKRHLNHQNNLLSQKLNELNDHDRQAVIDYLDDFGFIKRPIQTWALVFLGAYFLFEVFFIMAWVKDMVLVWQPDWATALIEWVRANTDFVSDKGVNHQLFAIRIKSNDTELYQLYTSEREFLASDFGGATALFQVFRTFCFPLLILSMISIFWKDLVHGLHEIDPRYGSYFFASIGGMAMNFLSLGFIFYFCHSLNETAKLLLGISYWIDNFFLEF